jgi:hypothetical protein
LDSKPEFRRDRGAVARVSFKVCLHETWILCHTTKNSVARHKIWSYDTNLVAQHKIWVLCKYPFKYFKQMTFWKNRPMCSPTNFFRISSKPYSGEKDAEKCGLLQ